MAAGSGSGAGSGAGAGSTPTKPAVPKVLSALTGLTLGATAATTGRSEGATTAGSCTDERSTPFDPVVVSVATEARSSTTPRGLALAGTAAAASRPPEVAATAVTFAERDRAMLVTVILLGARWRPLMRWDTLNLSMACGDPIRTGPEVCLAAFTLTGNEDVVVAVPLGQRRHDPHSCPRGCAFGLYRDDRTRCGEEPLGRGHIFEYTRTCRNVTFQ